MRTIPALLLIAALQSGGQMVSAQQPDAKVLPAAVISAADVAAILATQKAVKGSGKGQDATLRTVDAGGHYVGVGLVHRAKGTPPGAASHDKVSEVLHVLEGYGTLVTGGAITNPVRRDAPTYTEAEKAFYVSLNGPGTGGDNIKGGVSKVVRKGDIVIIPAGTPHMWADTTEDLTYSVVRIDPARVIWPLK